MTRLATVTKGQRKVGFCEFIFLTVMSVTECKQIDFYPDLLQMYFRCTPTA